MQIQNIFWFDHIIDKLAFKHQVEVEIEEVEEILFGKYKLRFIEKGNRKGEDLYMALGQTRAGRYLSIFFIFKTTNEPLIISARDMDTKERKLYGKK